MKAKFTSLTDSQWQIIEKKLGKQRKSKHSLRTIINAILWLNYTGVQWREMDTSYPKWQTVYYHFRQLKLGGVWEELLDFLVVKERQKLGKEASPSLLAIDRQTVKTVQFVSEEIGIDGNKKMNGRKRTILVDKLGLPLAIKITAANVTDNEAGIQAVKLLKGKVPLLEKIAADQGYKDTFITYIKEHHGWEVEIAPQRRPQKPESQKGFVPEKNRWQVERSFSWLNFRRRLFREIEKTIESAEAMLQIAFISFSINKL